ncbi:hypothetical protein UVI_02010220 [Ustilaginoidea virens]|nr:hypothetical protein UVI_02010220 [Ustilaginoidea virens]
MFAKRIKGLSGTTLKDVSKKPSSFVLRQDTLTPSALVSPAKASTAPRRTLQPKSPFAKLNTTLVKSCSVPAPAGRSPTRGKRPGILSNRQRTARPFARVDSPLFSLDSSAAPFSLDAALKGTIASYGSRPRSNALSQGSTSPSSFSKPDIKAGWFFDIHEDSPEQEMTNLLQHSTCILDISSDEESEQKARRETEEGRDKENIPPCDHISQASTRRSSRAAASHDIEEKRVALGEMNTADFYADGCDETSLIIIYGDEDQVHPEPDEDAHNVQGVDFAAAPGLESIDSLKEIDQLMSKTESLSQAAVLQPLEGTGETFDLWESDSAKDEKEPVAANS